MLKLANVFVKYGKKEIINDVSLEVLPGEVLCIIGANGCGKTTLLRAISNFTEYQGSIKLNESEINRLKRKIIGKNISFLSQNNNSYFAYTVYDCVLIGRYSFISNFLGRYSKDDHEKVIDALKMVNMYQFKDKTIDQLSGGELQRIYLARLIVQQPKLTLLDEPTNHLDLKYQIEILDYVKNWTVSEKIISVIVLHDLNLVQKYADKVILLDKGKYYFGESKDILSDQNLVEAFGMSVKEWMLNCLELWK